MAVDSATVQRQLSSTCPRKLQEYVGGSTDARRLSRFNVVWYSPTLDQSDQGADWFRCDVIAFAGQDRLASLPAPGRLRGVLDSAKALSTYGLCGNAAPGARGFQRVICGRRHSWQAIATIGLAGGTRYPGAAAVRKAGDSACKEPGPVPVGQHAEVPLRVGVADAGAVVARAALRLLLGAVLEAELAQLLGVALPVLGDLHVQVEVDRRAEQRLDLRRARRCRRP